MRSQTEADRPVRSLSVCMAYLWAVKRTVGCNSCDYVLTWRRNKKGQTSEVNIKGSQIELEESRTFSDSLISV